MKVILIDDEQLAIDVLEVLLAKITGIEIVGKYTDPKVAILALPKINVDVVFLDIEMGGLHGLEIAEKIQSSYPELEIIFVTAYPEFALGAFEVNAIDYLLKPVNEQRMNQAIVKLKEKFAIYKEAKQAVYARRSGLFIQVMGDFHLLDMYHNKVKWRTRKVKELFILLWHHGDKGIRRSKVIADLWPELPEDKAATLMHTTVYQLRKVIRDIGFENPVILRNKQYMLNVKVKSDFDILKGMLTSSEVNASIIESAIELYRGDYLEVENYHWALSKQGEIRGLFIKYLERYLMIADQIGDKSYPLEESLKVMIELEPYVTRYAYLLLDHYGETGNTQKMVTLFQEIKLRWIGELGVDIPKEIIDIYEKHIK